MVTRHTNQTITVMMMVIIIICSNKTLLWLFSWHIWLIYFHIFIEDNSESMCEFILKEDSKLTSRIASTSCHPPTEDKHKCSTIDWINQFLSPSSSINITTRHLSWTTVNQNKKGGNSWTKSEMTTFFSLACVLFFNLTFFSLSLSVSLYFFVISPLA